MSSAALAPEVRRSDPTFDDWAGLHALLADTYAYMEGRIDPPSAFSAMTPADLEAKARDEVLATARDGRRVVACAYFRPHAPALRVDLIAVSREWRGRGLLRALFAAASDEARARGLIRLEIETRVELTENHATFGALGFAIARTDTHEGFDRPTSLVMQRPVD